MPRTKISFVIFMNFFILFKISLAIKEGFSPGPKARFFQSFCDNGVTFSRQFLSRANTCTGS